MSTLTLSGKAYNYIKDKIFNSEKGRYLSVREMANEIGVSYTPVREAFQRLEREGLLQLVPKVGFFVPRMDIADIVEIFQVRECIERFVFERVFDQITETDLQKISDLIDRQEQCLKNGQISEYVRLDEEIHMTFFVRYKNSHFIQLIKNVREQYLICSIKIAKQGSIEAINEHRQIVAHTRSRNREKAVELLVAHIESAKQRMRDGYISVLE